MSIINSEPPAAGASENALQYVVRTRNKIIMRSVVWRHSLPICLLTAFVALFNATPLFATTITVTNNADSGPGSLRQALIAAQENDTITFADNVRGSINILSALPTIVTTLTIVGPGANLLTLNGVNTSLISINALGRTIAISGLTFANGRGGAIWNDANLALTRCVVTGCLAVGQPFLSIHGGAIFNSGSLEAVGCTLSGNTVQGGAGYFYLVPVDGGNGYGGALSNWAGAIAILRDCTISGNQAVAGPGGCFNGSPFCSSPGIGGGGAIDNQGTLTVESCTIAGNSATNYGGGVVVSGGGTTRFANTILAKNTALAQPDAGGSFTSDGFNLIGNSDGSTGFTATGDQTGTLAEPIDPLLGPLQDNGGPTATMALLPGSPAIDKGNAATVTTDQRGSRRRDELPNIPNATGGDASDIGAFEVRHASLLNISTRARILPGEDALIAGFIITPDQIKQIIVRGIGPSLLVPGHLEDPTIEVFDNYGNPIPTAYNDNWMDATSAPEIAQTLPPTNPLESALWGTISPTAYSVVLRGRNNSSGIAVVETYDLDPSADSGLGNISTRGLVGTNDEAMICGIIVGPSSMVSIGTRVVLRAIGPSLAQFGIAHSLANPTIDVRDANGTRLVFNDDWQSDSGAGTISALGLAPSEPEESATIITVLDGAYTAIVRGAADTTGVALVEAYDVGPE